MMMNVREDRKSDSFLPFVIGSHPIVYPLAFPFLHTCAQVSGTKAPKLNLMKSESKTREWHIKIGRGSGARITHFRLPAGKCCETQVVELPLAGLHITEPES